MATGRPDSDDTSADVGRRKRPLDAPARRQRRRLGALGAASARGPPRSIFGARLRTRCPQYGHSVTYGLTSDPQFLQTTKRSAPRAMCDR